MKNKELFYLALAIGGAFLIHKYLMKPKTNGQIKTPVQPSDPLLTSLVNNDIIKISSSSEMPNLLSDQHYQALQYSEYTPDTYQTYYGKAINNGVVRGVNGSVPLIC